MLVDDNLTNLQVLYQALEDEGYELLVAQSGEEAIEIAKEANPSVVLLDINMPGIDGYETCRRMKSDDGMKDAVVFFLSARGELDDKLLHLTALIRNHLGGETVQFIRSSVIGQEGKRVLAVECLRSQQPVYFRRDSEEFFYVRAGPSTQQLSPSEVVAYLEGRK